jgi:hypothetical protein
MQAELQVNFQVERSRAGQLAESLTIAEGNLSKCHGPIGTTGTTVTLVDTATIEPDPPGKSFADVSRHQVATAQPETCSEEFMRKHLRRICTIDPNSWCTPVAECHLPLLPKHHAIPGRTAESYYPWPVHHDAAIAVLFIGRNVAAILCTRNSAPSLTSFLAAMGAKDYLVSSRRQSRQNAAEMGTALLPIELLV